jgi:hypothetical protein
VFILYRNPIKTNEQCLEHEQYSDQGVIKGVKKLVDGLNDLGKHHFQRLLFYPMFLLWVMKTYEDINNHTMKRFSFLTSQVFPFLSIAYKCLKFAIFPVFNNNCLHNGYKAI